MNKEELKNIILKNVNLSQNLRAELELFFQRDDITIENCVRLFNEWRESENGKTASEIVDHFVLSAKYAQILQSLNSIEYHNYSILSTRNLWLGVVYTVRDNSTHLLGLTTANGEVFPCIFDGMSVSLTGYCDTVFMGRKYSFGFLSDYNAYMGAIFSYGEDGFYRLEPNKTVIREKKGGEEFGYTILDLDEITQTLIDLLNINHRCSPKGE